MPGINQAAELTPDINREIDEMFQYNAWNREQQIKGLRVREALADAVRAIVANVPPCADRTVAIRKIREARMDANSAITFNGKY